MANYNRLLTGMTYAQVVQILGKESKEREELGSNETGSYKIVIYKWDGDGGDFGTEITAFFKNGKLDSKLQFGLK